MVRDSDSLEVVRLDSCLDKIQRLEWTRRALCACVSWPLRAARREAAAPCPGPPSGAAERLRRSHPRPPPNPPRRDSALVLCASYKKAAVHCFSISDPDWVCKIDEGAAGLAFAWWAPCGQQVLCVAEFNIRLTAWSLTDRGCFQMRARARLVLPEAGDTPHPPLRTCKRPRASWRHRLLLTGQQTPTPPLPAPPQGPKFAHKGLSASPSGQFLAVAERRDCRDHVTVFQVKGWKARPLSPGAWLSLSLTLALRSAAWGLWAHIRSRRRRRAAATTGGGAL